MTDTAAFAAYLALVRARGECVRREARLGDSAASGALAHWKTLAHALALAQPGQPVEIPTATKEYLAQVAWRISELAKGRDYAKVAKHEGPRKEGGFTLVAPTLRPPASAAKVAAALGLVAPRRSAFREARALDRARAVASAVTKARLDDIAPSDARIAGMKAAGMHSSRADHDDAKRSLRRIIKRAE